jgi:hypothetical protein
MEKNTKILYVNPNSEFEYSGLTSDEMRIQSESDENAVIYSTIDEFAIDFNNEFISDQGFMYVLK